jgi:hypothetical protein
MSSNERYSLYYHAQVKRELCWQLSAALKGTENVAFDRAVDSKSGIFEFYVPEDTNDIFLQLMEYMKSQGVVLSLEQLPNRLKTESI